MEEKKAKKEEKKNASRQLNNYNYYGKVNNEMINTALDEVQNSLRRIVEQDPKNAKTIISSITKILSDEKILINDEINQKALPKASKNDEEDKAIIERITKLSKEEPNVAKLRTFANLASKIIKIPITHQITSNKVFLLGWFKDNIEAIERAFANGEFN
ncbi:hypothetical protein TVAG_225800 [Trichomonas vaginalis G3]|uniref:Uncharacterized protein n=1 Tax=Trichomonas vaginalis (strain ATCC PRA-98 / G3) TaxID=412133 RepID=A2DNV9_TRIV3|nr:hypothetical protein TVAGG3_0289380 [Trichomonas vaginalis G3]EAY17954.1 hypothetical protein TVAG_225800 [Trichomonas vaginalis G3]KAI5527136.1 hypothetical protein TVAGG3_0289380 [Trichomonas vaginalis G3]|eukprot:XP_001578940.1 hypothetical protein [Trichomonas vaginalis G3]